MCEACNPMCEGCNPRCDGRQPGGLQPECGLQLCAREHAHLSKAPVLT